jgi:hypothetical protein
MHLLGIFLSVHLLWNTSEIRFQFAPKADVDAQVNLLTLAQPKEVKLKALKFLDWAHKSKHLLNIYPQLEVLLRQDKSDEVKERAVWLAAIIAIHRKEEVPLIVVEAILHDNEDVASTAASVIGPCKLPTGALPILLKATFSKFKLVRSNSVSTIGCLTQFDNDTLKRLEQLKSDECYHVRYQSYFAIYKITKNMAVILEYYAFLRINDQEVIGSATSAKEQDIKAYKEFVDSMNVMAALAMIAWSETEPEEYSKGLLRLMQHSKNVEIRKEVMHQAYLTFLELDFVDLYKPMKQPPPWAFPPGKRQPKAAQKLLAMGLIKTLDDISSSDKDAEVRAKASVVKRDIQKLEARKRK